MSAGIQDVDLRSRGMRLEVNAFVGFFERQRNLYRRYWVWEVVWLVYSIVSTLSIGYLASGLGSFSGSNARVNIAQAQLYLLIGSLLWSYLSLMFFDVSFAIAWERWEGTIEYTVHGAGSADHPSAGHLLVRHRVCATAQRRHPGRRRARVPPRPPRTPTSARRRSSCSRRRRSRCSGSASSRRSCRCSHRRRASR